MKTRLFIDATNEGIKRLAPRVKRHQRNSAERGPLSRHWMTVARKELRAYFEGRLTSFSPPCDLRDLSQFTLAVLRMTARIPYGEVRSYRWLAESLGKPKAVRAVGNALARNPVPIIIPCHRVVRSDGTTGGFALGRKWKQKLLRLEKSFRPS